MLCPHCGKELREAAVFCMYCGTPVGQRAPYGGKDFDRTAVASLIFGIVSLLISGGFLILPTIGVILSLRSEPSGVARTGLYLNALAFVPGILHLFG